MTLAGRTESTLEEVERRLDRFFDDADDRAARHSPHYRALWRELRGATGGGKRLRPRLLLAAHHHLEGGRADLAIEVALSIELLHTALLLHDDVIDGDVERRGSPNVVGAFSAAAAREGRSAPVARRWGENAGVLAGDLLLAAAMGRIAALDIDAPRRDRLVALFDESIFRAAAGELADVAYAVGLATPSPDQVREMMADKTAHYSLELPLRSAAILAGAADGLEDGLGAIGRSIGILFQMQDDLLGVFGDPGTTGKSTVSDLREGKQTMLVAFARGTAEWREAEVLFGAADLTEPGAAALRSALDVSGARERFEDAIRRQRMEVRRAIARAGLPAPLAAYLEAEGDRAAERRA